MSNFNILQLNAKELSELKDIATELGLKVSNSATKETLVYDILDQQAVVNAQRKTNIEKPDTDRKKRLRVPVKKTGDQKVFTTGAGKETAEQAPKPENQTVKTEMPEIIVPAVKIAEAPVQETKAPSQKKSAKAKQAKVAAKTG